MIETEHLQRCVQTLESSLELLAQAKPDSIEYEVYRNAVVKGFDLALEMAGKLLRRALKSYEGNPKAVDALFYKDVLRQAAKHSLMTIDTVERWFKYRDNRNDTAHDYGVAFAHETLQLLPDFIVDASALILQLQQKFGAKNDDNT